MFLQMGDIHYGGHKSLKADDFQYAYYELFKKNKVQASFYTSHLFSNVFDDHDFGSNNADGGSNTNKFANQAYRESIRDIDLDEGIYHSYQVQVGSSDKFLKFIMLDMRTFKFSFQNYGPI